LHTEIVFRHFPYKLDCEKNTGTLGVAGW